MNYKRTTIVSAILLMTSSAFAYSPFQFGSSFPVAKDSGSQDSKPPAPPVSTLKTDFNFGNKTDVTLPLNDQTSLTGGFGFDKGIGLETKSDGSTNLNLKGGGTLNGGLKGVPLPFGGTTDIGGSIGGGADLTIPLTGNDPIDLKLYGEKKVDTSLNKVPLPFGGTLDTKNNLGGRIDLDTSIPVMPVKQMKNDDDTKVATNVAKGDTSPRPACWTSRCHHDDNNYSDPDVLKITANDGSSTKNVIANTTVAIKGSPSQKVITTSAADNALIIDFNSKPLAGAGLKASSYDDKLNVDADALAGRGLKVGGAYDSPKLDIDGVSLAGNGVAWDGYRFSIDTTKIKFDPASINAELWAGDFLTWNTDKKTFNVDLSKLTKNSTTISVVNDEKGGPRLEVDPSKWASADIEWYRNSETPGDGHFILAVDPNPDSNDESKHQPSINSRFGGTDIFPAAATEKEKIRLKAGEEGGTILSGPLGIKVNGPLLAGNGIKWTDYSVEPEHKRLVGFEIDGDELVGAGLEWDGQKFNVVGGEGFKASEAAGNGLIASEDDKQLNVNGAGLAGDGIKWKGNQFTVDASTIDLSKIAGDTIIIHEKADGDKTIKVFDVDGGKLAGENIKWNETTNKLDVDPSQWAGDNIEWNETNKQFDVAIDPNKINIDAKKLAGKGLTPSDDGTKLDVDGESLKGSGLKWEDGKFSVDTDNLEINPDKVKIDASKWAGKNVEWNTTTKQFDVEAFNVNTDAGIGLIASGGKDGKGTKLDVDGNSLAGDGIEWKDNKFKVDASTIDLSKIAGDTIILHEKTEGDKTIKVFDVDGNKLAGPGLLAIEEGKKLSVDGENLKGNGLKWENGKFSVDTDNLEIDPSKIKIDASKWAGKNVEWNTTTKQFDVEAFNVNTDAGIGLIASGGKDGKGTKLDVDGNSLAGDGIEWKDNKFKVDASTIDLSKITGDTIIIHEKTEGDKTIKVFDVDGKKLAGENIKWNDTTNRLDVDPSQWAGDNITWNKTNKQFDVAIDPNKINIDAKKLAGDTLVVNEKTDENGKKINVLDVNGERLAGKGIDWNKGDKKFDVNLDGIKTFSLLTGNGASSKSTDITGNQKLKFVGDNIDISQTTIGDTTTLTFKGFGSGDDNNHNNHGGGDKDKIVIGDIIITPDGIDAGNKTIINVAPGVNETDAVNVGQLQDLAGTVTKIKNNLDKQDKQSRSGISGAMAMANLPQVNEAGASYFSAGAGSYRGQGALALGFSASSNDGKWILKTSSSIDSQKKVGFGVGVAYKWK